MKKSLPETGGRVLKVLGAAEQEAKLFRKRIDESEDLLSVTGKKFYVSQNGNDNNDGTSPERAFKTLERVAQLGDILEAGDGVFLERDSLFRTSFDFNLKSGVTYGAYGQGKKPLVCGSCKNYAQREIWDSTEMEYIWKISDFPLSDVGIIVLDGGAEVGKKQMLLSELTENDDYYHDWDEKALYFYCDLGNPAEIFSDIEMGVKTRLFHLPAESYDITVDNIGFCYTGLFGIRSDERAKNITITNCTFAWLGGSLFNNKTNRFGNGIEFAAGCEDVLVKNCSFDQIFDSGVTFQIGNFPYRNFKVEDCLFEYNGMSCFEWWASGDQGEKDGIPIDITVIENILLENNLFRLTGFGWSKAVRCPTHIRNGWRAKWFPNLKNFTIKNNIFDYANGPITISGWKTAPESYSLCGNTYYQRSVSLKDSDVKNTDDKYFPFATTVDNENAASNYEEFVRAVGAVDKSPEKIEWLSL